MEIIQEGPAREFIKRLPDLALSPPSVHLQMLAIRSRYAKEKMGVRIHDIVIERNVVRLIPNWRERYFNDVYNLAVLQHEGKYDFRDLTISPDVTGILATVGPRSVIRAVADLMKENIEYLYVRDESALTELIRINSRYFGFLHKHNSKNSTFVTLDVDAKTPELFKEVKDETSPFPYFAITQPNRGFHFILNLTRPADAAAFYGEGKALHVLRLKHPEIELQRDSQEPLVGTHYGSKPDGSPKFVELIQ